MLSNRFGHRYVLPNWNGSFRIVGMSHESIPHFHNTQGLARISIGSKEFQCVGALPPFDHPHVYLDMGSEAEIVCPYCSTHYAYDPHLAAGTSEPLSAIFHTEPA